MRKASMTPWFSLYSACADREAVAAALRESLAAFGYSEFNPFGAMPGRSYREAVRLFVAPATNGWTRVIGEPDPAQIAPLSMLAPCLLLALSGSDARIEAYANGESAAVETALTAHAHPNCIPRALSLSGSASAPRLGAVELDALPDAVREMAQGIDLKQAGSLFSRLSANLMKKAGGEEAAARQLLDGDRPDWNSPGGARIQALLTCLGLGSHEPDFVTLRDAYALHERRRRNPNAMLYPGDAEAMRAVPDALSYQPVYAGRD